MTLLEFMRRRMERRWMRLYLRDGTGPRTSDLPRNTTEFSANLWTPFRDALDAIEPSAKIDTPAESGVRSKDD